MFTVPVIERPEWRKLVRREISHNFQNYVLQMIVDQTVQQVKDAKLTELQAISDLHNLCNKYALAVQNDLKSIFKDW
ncbi:MAG: hypothetical protein GW810_00035 [Flavobacteriales bacterium]|nr:hypothetical protein [Flavobacteriales bacterium]